MKRTSHKIIIAVLIPLIILLALAVTGYILLASHFQISGDMGDNVHYLYNEDAGTLILYGEGQTWEFWSTDSFGGLFPEDAPYSLFESASPEFKNTLKRVIVLEGVDSITANSFRGCENLETLYFPATLKIIENDAFDDCPAIRTVYFNGDAPNLSVDSFGTDSSSGNRHNQNITVIHQAGTTGYDQRGWGFPEAIIEQKYSIPWLSILFGG